MVSTGNLLFIQSGLLKYPQTILSVTQLANEQEVHLTHSVAHMLRTEQALVSLQPRLYSLDLSAHVQE